MASSDSTTKQCKTCGEVKPLNEFHKQKDNFLGRRSDCRKCRAIKRGSNPKSYHPPKPDLIPDGYKLCTHCSRVLPAIPKFFNKHPGGHYGLHSWCRDCRLGLAKSGRLDQGMQPKNHPLIKGDKRRCNLCLEWKDNSLGFYNRDKASLDGLSTYCKSCVVKRSVEYQKRNPDKHAVNNKKYAVNNKVKYAIISQKRRARKENLPYSLTVGQWEDALLYWNNCCAICGQAQDFWHIIAADHWISIADNRPDNPGTVADNILPLCHSIKGSNGLGACNQSKTDKDPIEWLLSKFGKKKADKKLAEIDAYFAWVKERNKDK